MNSKKIIAIMGATGAQGGGLARAILEDEDSQFSVRAITRNPESEKAKVLAQMGAQVVRANSDDAATLRKAFEGAYGAYCLTNYWEHMSPAKETAQATAMAEAAKDAGIRHAIWSTFEDTRTRYPLSDNRMPTLMEKYKVPHFDSKAEADKEFTARKVPTTFLLTSFYWDNFIYFGLGPKKGPDGVLAITFPLDEKKMPGMWAGDIGKCAYGIFKGGQEYIGKTVGIAGEHIGGAGMAAIFSKVLGKEVRYNAVTPDVYRGFGFPGADDMGNMFQFKRDYESEYRGARPVELSRKLNPELLNFEQWLTKYKERIPMD
jgi:uncharacterized protein YbjT (DUF2867 family)